MNTETTKQKQEAQTAEEMIEELMSLKCGDTNRLLLITPNDGIEAWKDDFDPAEFQSFRDEVVAAAEYKSTRITILKGRIAEGYVPVGFIGFESFKHRIDRLIPAGYLPEVEARRLLKVWMWAYESGWKDHVHQSMRDRLRVA